MCIIRVCTSLVEQLRLSSVIIYFKRLTTVHIKLKMYLETVVLIKVRVQKINQYLASCFFVLESFPVSLS